MKLLFVVPYVPNLVRVRPYNLLRNLAERGHDITLATVWENEAEFADLEALRPWCRDMVALPLTVWRKALNLSAALPSRAPLQASYSWQPALLAPLVNGGAAYDVIHFEHLRGARFGLALQQALPQTPIVWDAVDSITHLFRQTVAFSRHWLGRWRSRVELARTRHFESRLLAQFDAVTVTSVVDREVLEQLNPQHGPIHVVPNGVDLGYFRPNPALPRHDRTIVISGKMSYHANISMVLHLVEQIMPLVWQQLPDARLQVVGKDPSREIRALADHPQITVTGSVPDMRPYLQQATVAVAPITYGAGIQNKVLEAMACATPVVATPKAIAALNVTPGHDILVAENPHRFAAHIIRLLTDPDRARRIGAASRRYVTDWHDWHENVQRLEASYYEVIHQRYPSAAGAPRQLVR